MFYALISFLFVSVPHRQAIRRVQASGGFLASSNAAAAAAPSAGGAGSSVSGVSGGPAVDPKEYKKDELPEKVGSTCHTGYRMGSSV